MVYQNRENYWFNNALASKGYYYTKVGYSRDYSNYHNDDDSVYLPSFFMLKDCESYER